MEHDKQRWKEVLVMDIVDLLLIEEDYSAVPYLCSERYPTIGIGTRIGPQGADINLYQMRINTGIARMMLSQDLKLDSYDISKEFNLNFFEPRYVIIQSMIYQLGLTGFLGFKKTIKLMKAGEWNQAAFEMLDSKWRRQTENRAYRHAYVIRYDNFGSYEDY